MIYGTNSKNEIIKMNVPRTKAKRGAHHWVAACDSDGNEILGFCEICGKKRESEEK